jgi:hypothetical protein
MCCHPVVAQLGTEPVCVVASVWLAHKENLMVDMAVGLKPASWINVGCSLHPALQFSSLMDVHWVVWTFVNPHKHTLYCVISVIVTPTAPQAERQPNSMRCTASSDLHMVCCNRTLHLVITLCIAASLMV